MTRTGRPSSYSEETADAICDRMSGGESLIAICAGKGQPDKATVFRWLGKYEGFRDKYARARELQMEAMAQEILQISDDGANDTYTVTGGDGERVATDVIARSKLRVDTRKWLMSKLAPKKYGDRLEVAGDPASPLVIEVVRFTAVEDQPVEIAARKITSEP